MKLKINFNQPFPCSERNDFIKAFQKIGFKYEHIFSDGLYSQHKLTGCLPSCRDPNVDIYLVDDIAREYFSSYRITDVEIYFLSERKNSK